MNVMSLQKHWNEIFSLQIWLGLQYLVQGRDEEYASFRLDRIIIDFGWRGSVK